MMPKDIQTLKELIAGFDSQLHQTAEDKAWDEMAPVGREFGSPDYERLMNEDADKFKLKLLALVADCQRRLASSKLVLDSELQDDTINVQTALRNLGCTVTLDVAAAVWQRHSRSLAAGWIAGADTVESAQRTLAAFVYLWEPGQCDF